MFHAPKVLLKGFKVSKLKKNEKENRHNHTIRNDAQCLRY